MCNIVIFIIHVIKNYNIYIVKNKNMDKKNNKCLKQIDILLTKTVKIGILSMLMLFWELDHVSDISKNTKK